MILKWGNQKIKGLGKDIEMKKYKIWTHKLYSTKDVERRIGIKEEKIIDLLEEQKIFGRKLMNFWLIRGCDIPKIFKLLKGDKKK